MEEENVVIEQSPVPVTPKKGAFSTWKLVSGILSIVVACFMLFQSCAAGLVISLSDSGSADAAIGSLVALLMLAGGIVSICCRKAGKGGCIAIAIVFGIAALCGFTSDGTYGDLVIWSGWATICAVLSVASIFKLEK